jgi:hypothetical protein
MGMSRTRTFLSAALKAAASVVVGFGVEEFESFGCVTLRVEIENASPPERR